MNILGIDTSTDHSSVAVQVNGHIQEICSQTIQEKSQKLLSTIDTILIQANIEPKDLDLLSFGAGPGSFTGLKVASCIMQGLHLAWGKPIIKISTLWALALQAHEELGAKLVISCLDAKMGQVYHGVYKFDQTTGYMLPIQSDTLGKLQVIKENFADATIIGDCNDESIFKYPKASSIVRLADYWYKKYRSSDNNAEPFYLRAI